MKYVKALNEIENLNEEKMKYARMRQNSLVKPLGSLGTLESISIIMAGITGQPHKNLDKKILFLFGADNGVHSEGVSAAPQQFTNILLNAYGRGVPCGINVICSKNNVDLKVVDMGVKGEVNYENILNRKLMAEGTGNFAQNISMDEETVNMAIESGFELAEYARSENYDIIGTGEVGMGNTATAAACIMSALNKHTDRSLIGRGAGLADEAFSLKQNIIVKALKMHKPDSDSPVDILSKVGGLDIAAMTGLYIGAAYYKIPIVIDGVISIAAALLAYKFNPLIKNYMFASHFSEEPAYKAAAGCLGIEPVLNLHMRLGEGTGCPIFMGVMENALEVFNKMVTFEELGI